MNLGVFAAVLLSATVAVGAFAKDEKSSASHPVEAPLPGYPAHLLTEGNEGRVEIEIQVDKKGAVSDVRVKGSSDARLEAPCEEAIRGWRFQPAKYFGKSTADTCRVTIHFKDGNVSMERPPDPRENGGIPPRVLKQVDPTYPFELRNSGNIGSVTIEVIIDTNGDAKDPKVVTSTHPLFEAPAVEALLKWKFAPGIIDGRPVNTKISQRIIFSLGQTGGVEGYAVEKRRGKGKKSDIPEELRFDTPPKPKTTVFAVHPYDDAIGYTKGSAEVKLVVGPDGNVLGTRIVKASKPEFGLALAAAMEAWTFEPALKDKKRVLALVNRTFEFEIGERDSTIDSDTAAIAARIRKNKFEPASARELDAPLKTKFAASPVYPTALKEKGVDGSAVVEIIIDKEGRAVLPRIAKASEPEFGWAAATAAQRWLFEPPTVGGKAVEVKVVIPFQFALPEPPAEEPAN